jgi:hypothetical protein
MGEIGLINQPPLQTFRDALIMSAIIETMDIFVTAFSL